MEPPTPSLAALRHLHHRSSTVSALGLRTLLHPLPTDHRRPIPPGLKGGMDDASTLDDDDPLTFAGFSLTASLRDRIANHARASPITTLQASTGVTLYVASLLGILPARALLFHPRLAAAPRWEVHRVGTGLLVLGTSLFDVGRAVAGMVAWKEMGKGLVAAYAVAYAMGLRRGGEEGELVVKYLERFAKSWYRFASRMWKRFTAPRKPKGAATPPPMTQVPPGAYPQPPVYPQQPVYAEQPFGGAFAPVAVGGISISYDVDQLNAVLSTATSVLNQAFQELGVAVEGAAGGAGGGARRRTNLGGGVQMVQLEEVEDG
ncbi:hypothetical protein HDU96_009805 [Phlyctochytrium bullatum]|nr:hypothetical protein HDU96_009805 [Phlyctochytrium bullatum]